jgi:hypothetical protein
LVAFFPNERRKQFDRERAAKALLGVTPEVHRDSEELLRISNLDISVVGARLASVGIFVVDMIGPCLEARPDLSPRSRGGHRSRTSIWK